MKNLKIADLLNDLKIVEFLNLRADSSEHTRVYTCDCFREVNAGEELSYRVFRDSPHELLLAVFGEHGDVEHKINELEGYREYNCIAPRRADDSAFQAYVAKLEDTGTFVDWRVNSVEYDTCG